MSHRASILDTATRLFAAQGFAGASLSAIAERVGISKPSLLYHFPSKDHLREEVLTALFEHWVTRLPNLLRAVTSGAGRFDALMDELWDFFEEDADRARLVVRELLDRPDEMRARVSRSLAPLVTLIADQIRKGQNVGLLRASADPESYVLHMIALTLASVTGASVALTILGDDASARTRQRDEVRRIAFSSLFSDSHPVPSPKTAGSVRPSPSE